MSTAELMGLAVERLGMEFAHMHGRCEVHVEGPVTAAGAVGNQRVSSTWKERERVRERKKEERERVKEKME